jgi:protein-arginine kinase activator protein McsA
VALFLTKRKEKSMTDKEKIEKGEYVDCWLCKDVFARIQQTGRYCSKCGALFAVQRK